MATQTIFSSSAISTGSGAGKTAWAADSDPTTDLLAADGSYFSAFLSSAAPTSETLRCTGFDFGGVPEGSTPLGITVTVNRVATLAGSISIKSTRVQLFFQGAAAGDNKADTSTAWLETPGDFTYGGSADPWGLTPALEDIQDQDNFGVEIVCQRTGAGVEVTAAIDSVSITLTYSPPSGGISTSESIIILSNAVTGVGAGTAISTSSGVAWNTDTNATALVDVDDVGFSSLLTLASPSSATLRATNFNFSSLPSTARIQGIVVRVYRSGSSAAGGNIVRDSRIQLYNSGAVGDNKADTATAWTAVTTVARYGSAQDMWGVQWTPALIKSTSTFGVELVAVKSPIAGNRLALVDAIIMDVYFWNYHGGASVSRSVSVSRASSPA